MKPNKIYLIRHGESKGNIDKDIYKVIPDWKVELTEKGHQQASDVAAELYRAIEGDVSIYNSPWTRAKQTTDHIWNLFQNRLHKRYEDPRLREQEWGNYQTDEFKKRIKEERYKFGTFFYRMPEGESGADVYDRVTTFLGTLYRDFEKEDCPKNIIIVSHGLTIRILLMRWLHWSVEKFESLENPDNCEVVEMELNKYTQKYELVSELKEKED